MRERKESRMIEGMEDWQSYNRRKRKEQDKFKDVEFEVPMEYPV